MRPQLVLAGDLLAQGIGALHDLGLYRRHHGAHMDIIFTMPRLRHHQRRRASRHLLQRGVQAQYRFALRPQQLLLRTLPTADDRNPRICGFNLRFGCGDFGRQHRALGDDPVGCAGRVAGLLPKHLASTLRPHGLQLGIAQCLLLIAYFGRALRHERCGESHRGQRQYREGQGKAHAPYPSRW